MEVKPGYMKTEVGVIPQDWEVQKLGEVAEKFVNGGTPSTKNENYWTGDIPWITGADILNQKVAEIRRYITKEAVKSSSTNVIGKGNLLLVSRTGVGKLAIAPFDIAISQDFTGVYVREDILIAEYLYRYFDFNQAVLQSQNQGTSIKGITRDTLSAISISFPPTIAEQRAIAGALSDVDTLMAKLDQLIAKKRDLKQAAMQQLLTGKKRLPGFSGDWEVKSLGSILSRGRLGGNYPNQDTETSKPLMKMGNIARGSIETDKIEYIPENIRPDPEHRLHFGDVLFNTRNTLDLVGKVAIWLDELPVAYYNSNLMRLEFNPEEICSNAFANYVLNSTISVARLRAIATGTTSVAAIYTRDLLQLAFPVPTKAEQTAIAGVLSDMDAEITALEQRLAKTRALKQGMMQELLTGRIRLV